MAKILVLQTVHVSRSRSKLIAFFLKSQLFGKLLRNSKNDLSKVSTKPNYFSLQNQVCTYWSNPSGRSLVPRSLHPPPQKKHLYHDKTDTSLVSLRTLDAYGGNLALPVSTGNRTLNHSYFSKTEPFEQGNDDLAASRNRNTYRMLGDRDLCCL